MVDEVVHGRKEIKVVHWDPLNLLRMGSESEMILQNIVYYRAGNDSGQ